MPRVPAHGVLLGVGGLDKAAPVQMPDNLVPSEAEAGRGHPPRSLTPRKSQSEMPHPDTRAHPWVSPHPGSGFLQIEPERWLTGSKHSLTPMETQPGCQTTHSHTEPICATAPWIKALLDQQ